MEEQKSGKVEYRVDKNGIVHCAVGRKSFEVDQLVGNTAALMDAILKAKPASSKGTYVKKIAVSTTMGPGIKVDPAAASAAASALESN